MKNQRDLLWTSVLSLSALLSACGGGGGGGTSTGAPPSGGGGGGPENMTDSLNQLGVDTAQTDRVGEDGEDLMAFSPLGTRYNVSSPAEILLVGIPHENSNGRDIAWLDDAAFEPPGALYQLAGTDAAWAHESINSAHGYASKRAVVAADLDADGREETASVRYENGGLYLQVWEDTLEVSDIQSAPATETTFLGNVADLVSVTMVAGDFDGDTHDELMVGYTTTIGAVIEVFDDEGFGFALDPSSRRTMNTVVFGSQVSVVLAAGNHDQDEGLEAVAILNEYAGFGSATRFALFDDAESDYALLDDGIISHGTIQAVVASAAFGDVDGDGIDELVFGGLSSLSSSQCEPSHYVGVAYDDMANGHGVLGGISFNTTWEECDDGGYVLEYVHVLAADIDDDSIQEIVLNQHIFELDAQNGSVWRAKLDELGSAMSIPDEAFFVNHDSGPFTRGSSTMTTGDLLSNGRDEVLIFRQSFAADVKVYGQTVNLQNQDIFAFRGGIDTAWGVSGAQESRNPIVLALDTDDDGTTLVREGVSHQLVFTEPIVLAVLAAPPTIAGILQNYDASTTTFGNTEFTGDAMEASLTTSASVSVGVKVDVPFINSGVEVKGSATASATAALGTSYSYSQTIEYTTGALEDTVIFSCIPMDRYMYRVVRDPDVRMIDAVVTIDMPRAPITLQVERNYFNANVLEGSPTIDASVLRHSIGDLDSYPTPSERNNLLDTWDGIQSDPLAVGQGNGTTSVTLGIEEATSMLIAMSIGFELELETTVGGATAGFSVGSEIGASYQTTLGTAMTYTGTVGSIQAPDFGTNGYQFGLFTYYQTHVTGQRFQVINYWVQE